MNDYSEFDRAYDLDYNTHLVRDVAPRQVARRYWDAALASTPSPAQPTEANEQGETMTTSAEATQKRAWAHMNAVLDEFGESPEYRKAWAEWEAVVKGTSGRLYQPGHDDDGFGGDAPKPFDPETIDLDCISGEPCTAEMACDECRRGE